MSNELKDKATEYLSYQLSILPTNDIKKPALKSWTPYKTDRMKKEEVETFFNGYSVKGIGIICGAISGGLEVIDVDTKYDLRRTLWSDLKALLEDNLPDTYNKLVIAQTKSGGYHIYYKCSSIAGNLKLANRPTVEAEKLVKYNEEIANGSTEAQASENKDNDKVRVLVETRGEGGYVIAPPTIGYKYIQGEPGNIPTITPEEREVIFSISRSFNELPEEQLKPKVKTTTSSPIYNSTGLSPFEDYNNRGEVVELLESNGWKVTNERGQRINLLRPGQTDSKTSGNFHKGLRVLRIFSSSTEFNTEKGYNPSQVFSLLECNGDDKIAYRRLLEMGYGEPYKGESITPTQVKTEKIKVEVVNKVTREILVITTPGETLKIENIKTAIGDEVVITSPGAEAMEEVIKAIELIEETNKKIYVKEGGIELRAYRYKLQYLFKKYGKIEDQKNGLTDRDKDNFLDEILKTAQGLKPIDKDIFLKEFLEVEEIKELGITEESLSITVDRLTSTRDKEAQAIDFKKLLSDATKLQDKGEVEKALDLLDSRVKDVKLKNKATEFSKLLLPTSEQAIKEEEALLPDSLNSGYKIGEDELLLPGGAITVYAAPTNHGKTILLINTMLNVVDKYPDRKFILFTYEERATAILQYFLNTYVDLDLNSSEKTNRRVIKDYFKTGSTQFISSSNLEFFNSKKEEFFKTYIETGRILVKYVDYNSQELTTAIRYLHKQEPNLGGVFIDYFQLLKLEKEKNSRQEELKNICMSLKDVAVDTGLPLILAAQFNREVTNLMRLHPTKIGEAGDIERIVNTLIGLWNMNKKPVLKGIDEQERYGIDSKLASKGVRGEGGNNFYLEVLKSRDIATGSFEFLEFNGNTGKVKNSSSSGSTYF